MKWIFRSFFFVSALLAKDPLLALDFQELLGKNTSRWEHVEEKDLCQVAFFQKIYEKNKSLQFASFSSYKIPQVVHFIWLGDKCFPPESVRNIRTWMAKHPDWIFKFWTDRKRFVPCQGMQICYIQDFVFEKLKACYEQATNFAEKADILSYEILWQEGGVYVDHDADALRAFDNLHKAYDLYACLETPQKRLQDYTITAGIGLMGAKPKHPVLGFCLTYLEENWPALYTRFPERGEHHEITRVMQGTYLTFTKALHAALGKEGNIDIVFPAAYFFAQEGLPSIYSTHFFGNSWIKEAKPTSLQVEFKKKIQKIRKDLSYLQGFNLAILSLGGLFFLVILGFRKKLFGISLFLFLPVGLSASDFSTLMGKGSSAWEHIQTKEDWNRYTFYEEIYQKVSLLPPQKEALLPKVFHFIWLGEEEIPMEFFRNIENWLEKNGEYTGILWTDKIRKFPMERLEQKKVQDFSFQWVQGCFKDTQNEVEKEYLLALEILYQHGGIFMGMDTKARQPLKTLPFTYTFFASLTAPEKALYSSSSIRVSKAVLAAKPFHPILQETLESLPKIWHEVALAFPENSQEAAGYRTYYRIFEPLHQAVQKKKGERDVVLPAGYFYKVGGKHALIGYDSFAYGPRKGKKSFEEVALGQLGLVSKKLQKQYMLSGIFFGLGVFGFIAGVLGVNRLRKK